MNYIIIYFLLNSTPYQLPLLPNMTRDEALKLELVPKEAKEITKEEFEKIVNISLEKNKQKK
jgi:hypothetical protein